MNLSIIIQKIYGVKEGLSIDLATNEIIEWPYDVDQPSQSHIAQMLSDYEPLVKKENLKSQLWSACTDYRKSRISEEGMIRLSPYENSHTKPGQIALWISSLWGSPSDQAASDGSYYSRRSFIEEGGVPSMDFSNFGELPVSFAESMQEILSE